MKEEEQAAESSKAHFEGWAENTGARGRVVVGGRERGERSGTRVTGRENAAPAPAGEEEKKHHQLRSPGSSWQHSDRDSQERSQGALAWEERWKARAAGTSQGPSKRPSAVVTELASVARATSKADERN